MTFESIVKRSGNNPSRSMAASCLALNQPLPSQYWRSRPRAMNFPTLAKENILLKNNIKWQKNGLIYLAKRKVKKM